MNRLAIFVISLVLWFSWILISCGGGGDGDGNGGGGDPNVGFEVEFVYVGGYIPSSLEEKDTYLYFSDDSEYPIKKVSKDGSAIIPLTIKMGTPTSFVVQEPYIYWVEVRSGSTLDCGTGSMIIKTLKRALLDGSSIQTLQEGCNNMTDFEGIRLNDTHAFWVNTPGSLHTIEQVSLSDFSATTIVSNPINSIDGIATDDTHVYWMEEHWDPFEVHVIKKVPIDGGNSETIASSLGGLAGNLLLNGPEIVWSDYDSILNVSKSGGQITTLATLDSAPKDIQMDSINVYWIDEISLNQMVAHGGTITELVGDLNSPVSLAVGSTQLMWVETECCAHGQTGSIFKVSKTGGSKTILTSEADVPGQAAFYDSTALFIEGGHMGTIEGFGRIAQIHINGGSIETFLGGISADWPSLTLDDSYLYVADEFTIKKIPLGGGFPENLAISNFYVGDLTTDGSYVYWTEDAPLMTIRKVSVSGGNITTLGSAHLGPSGPIELVGDTLYWMASHDTFKKILTSGGSPSTIATNLPYLSDFAVDDTYLYFSENDTRKIRKVSVNGGLITDLALGNWGYNILAADQDHLYWLNQTSLRRIQLDGGDSDTIKSSNLGPIPFFHPSLVADSTHIYWTETAYGLIMRASKTPVVQ